MSSENPSTESEPASDIEKSKASLLTFDDSGKASTGKDINTKISALDTDLTQLRTELGAINSSVEQGLDRLGDTDTDLTAKVSETYKRLGEIDNSYKSLLEISSRIDNDIQRLNGDVNAVAEQSATGIKTLELSTISQSNEFAHKNQQVVSQVNHVLETSKLTGELLAQKVQATTDKLLHMEAQVVNEIETLSSVVNNKTDAITVSVEGNKARILKLQSVDEAIIKRATTLEISSAELTVKSRDIQISVEQLQMSTCNLSNGLGELKEKTRALEDITNNHGSLINGLQKVTSDMTAKLSSISGRESKHFNMVTVAFLMLLIATAVIYFSQQSQFDVSDVRAMQNNQLLEKQLVTLQDMQMRSTEVARDSLAVLENKVAQLDGDLQKKINGEFVQMDSRVRDIQDQVTSIGARLTNDLPFSEMGDDNVIHGAHWISRLPEQNYAIQVAYVDDINKLYELAQRYNYYLNDSLSYFEVSSNNDTRQKMYVLLSGNYATRQQAETALQSIPGYIDMQLPVLQKLAKVQQYIAQI